MLPSDSAPPPHSDHPTMTPPVAITPDNVDQFLRGVDAFVCDCDGVLWTPQGPIENAMAALKGLRACGKRVYFVTNNSTHSIMAKLNSDDFPVKEDEIAIPATVIARYLQRIGFSKKAFVFGVEYFKNVLRDSGIRVVPEEKITDLVSENVSAFAQQIELDPEVGAVILDMDMNIRLVDLCSAASILRSRPECLFLAGATDTVVPLPNQKVFFGPGPFLKMLEDASGRKAHVFGKPGPAMVTEHLQTIHDLDARRTVFVGDALKQDMGIASACGMQKLLVFSGVAQPQDLDSCPENLRPDFTVRSIGDFVGLLQELRARTEDKP